ncbi:MAG: ERF family protein, partial [Mycobacterium sp.]
ADLSDIWDAIRPPLAAHGLAVTQSLTGGSSGYMGIRTTVWHTSGQHISDTVELAINARTPQEVGSQVTYFKRYALSALLG